MSSASRLSSRAARALEEGRPAEAAGLFEAALALAPRAAFALWGLAAAHIGSGRLEEGIEAFRAGLEKRPGDTCLLSGLADAYLTAGLASESIRLLKRALELDPADETLHGQFLYALNHACSDAAAIAEAHAVWGRRFARPRRRVPAFASHPDPHRRPLRIGYVSDGFRRRAVGWFLAPLLEAHDHEAFEIVCYDTGDGEDDVHRQMKQAASQWRAVHGWSNRRLGNAIRRDAIDILVDLSGHMGGHRLPVFAARAAPVQVTYLGYPNTTGMRQMDYRLTDAIADPPGMTEHLHTEKLLRLERCFLAYRPPCDAPQVIAAQPALTAGYFTFGSFCRPCKLSEPAVAAWAEILRRVPHSRLLLHHQVMRPFPGEAALFIARQIAERFAAHGVEHGRVEFAGRLETGGHFELYNCVDLCLDPFPYNGTTALCEGLWMGVPAVALAGDTHVSRTAASVLTAAGLAGFLCPTIGEYIAMTVQWGRHPQKVAALRSGMRRRLTASELFDGAGLARAIEREYGRIWREYCGGGGR